MLHILNSIEGELSLKKRGRETYQNPVAPLQSALKELGAKLRNGGNVAVGAAKALPYHSAQPFVVRKGEPGTGCR